MLDRERVLVVEDEALIGEELCDRLVRMGLVPAGPVRTGRRAIEAVDMSPPDLILMDVHLDGDMDGVEATHHIRSAHDVPVVFLTAFSDDATVRRVSGTAPFGYLLKPTSDAALRTTIPAALHRHRCERAERQASRAREASLQDAALRDDLTGQWNRRGILRILETEATRATRERRALTILMVDVDRLKSINDTYGHLVGDAVLTEVARRMQEATRPYDSIGRVGGDEFLLVSPEGRWLQAAHLANRLQSAVSERPIQVDDHVILVSVSIGVCSSPCGGDTDPFALLEAADQSLYQVKGRYSALHPAPVTPSARTPPPAA